MRRILSLVIILILITGCEAVYEISINDDFYTESLEINNHNPKSWNVGPPTTRYKEIIMRHLDENFPTDYLYEPAVMVQDDQVGEETKEEVNFYRIRLIDTSDNLGLRMSYTFNGIEEYKNSSIVMNNWQSFVFVKENNILKLNSGLDNYSFNIYERLTNLKVKLVTNYLVKEHNADEAREQVLYWNFTRENYKNKEIKVVLDMDEIVEDETDMTKKSDNFIKSGTLIIIYIVIFVTILLIGVPFIYFKVKNSNL